MPRTQQQSETLLAQCFSCQPLQFLLPSNLCGTWLGEKSTLYCDPSSFSSPSLRKLWIKVIPQMAKQGCSSPNAIVFIYNYCKYNWVSSTTWLKVTWTVCFDLFLRLDMLWNQIILQRWKGSTTNRLNPKVESITLSNYMKIAHTNSST